MAVAMVIAVITQTNAHTHDYGYENTRNGDDNDCDNVSNS